MAKIAKKFKVSNITEPTLEEAFTDFCQEKRGLGRSEATVRNYELSYNIFVDYHGINDKTFLVKELEEKQFYKWRQHMIEEEKRPQSINHYLRDWRTFLNWCKAKEYLEEPITIKEMKAQEDLPKMYSDDEIKLMLTKPAQGASYTQWRMWAIISLVYSTGMRASSVCALRIEDIDFNKGYIAIPQQKNKKAGMLPITNALDTVLQEYIKKWLKDEPLDAYLFQNVGGEQLTVNALHTSINKYCKYLGFEGHGIHSIRHNFAREMILNGGGEYRLQAYLQHSNIQMSQHYVKLFSGDLKKDAETFNPLDVMKKKTARTSKFKKG